MIYFFYFLGLRHMIIYRSVIGEFPLYHNSIYIYVCRRNHPSNTENKLVINKLYDYVCKQI